MGPGPAGQRGIPGLAFDGSWLPESFGDALRDDQAVGRRSRGSAPCAPPTTSRTPSCSASCSAPRVDHRRDRGRRWWRRPQRLVTVRLDEILASGVARGATPGVVGVVVDRDGVIYEGAFGERSLGSGTAMTVDTVGAIFSMTKAVTAGAPRCSSSSGACCLSTPPHRTCARSSQSVRC